MIHNELGTLKISGLLKMYAVPGIIAMTASSLYNMVDSIFIGHIPDVGAMAISGLAVTFPLMNLSSALGALVGLGSATMISVFLGQKNHDTANKVFANAFTLNVIIGIIFTLALLPFIDPILYFFGASANTLPFARTYMTIILAGNVFTHLYFGLNAIARSSGNPKFAMGLTIFTVAFNAILDPLMIFGLGMGIAGAAYATIIAQIIALAVECAFFCRKDNVIGFTGRAENGRTRIFRTDKRIIENIVVIGMGPFLMNSAACIVTLFINQQLKKYGGDLSIGAYGIINRITFLFIMINMGLNQGMQPIVGYNFGAKQYTRVRQTLRLAIICASCVTCIGFIVLQSVPRAIVGIFTSDPELSSMACHGLRLITVAMPLIGFQMVTTNFFQCLGMVRKSIALSLSRQLILLVPLLYVLPIFMDINGIWYSFPISDTLSCILAGVFLIAINRKFRLLKDGDDPGILGSDIR